MMVAKATLWVAVATMVGLILGWMGLSMTKDGPLTDSPPQMSPSRQVSVRLLGQVSGIAGIEVPKRLARQSDTYLHALEPANVTVHLPRERTVRVWSKLTSVDVDHGVVVDVHLLPLVKSLTYREAVAELRRCMRTMDIEPDELMRKQMATWPDDSPGYSVGFYPLTYSTGVNLSESVKFSVDVRPADDGGWFLALMFSAIGDARRAVWDPTFNPAGKSPADKAVSNPPADAHGGKDK